MWMLQVNGRASQVECAVQGLLLDELELASLRGEVQEALLSLNLEQRLGRAVVAVAGPRFSGLQGRSLSGGLPLGAGRRPPGACRPAAGQLQVRQHTSCLLPRSSTWEDMTHPKDVSCLCK